MSEPTIPSADAPPSRTFPNLDRFSPDGINALATVGLMLLDALNRAHLAVNEARLSHDVAVAYRRKLDDLYNVQDVLHGDASKLPAALAGFLSMAEERQRAASEEMPVGAQRTGQRDQAPARLAASASAKTDTNAHGDSQPAPYFTAAGNPALLFVVSDDITAENTLLRGASMFLPRAVSVGNDPEALDDDGRWAAVHLREMAKAPVDTVVNEQLESHWL
ncbi:MAG: hypothetical protein AW11_00901 [Candidatus Accumulibacter regalis]|uniref:Uncharacterized protein n=1 Tax=Accumulibacter regalis TaxID=522306 RepID=A0A011P5H8_ACCRE|nr:hypothetical protein [Accumulibacter sp.]EXI90198.1 MAG: hypothetical protein AW11_00901 [Candidatus Accumulibacter regalis]HRE72283.1 hypothetical protein [Accumulibacter sp.]